MTPAAEQFRDAIRAAGLSPPDDLEPGRFHRVPGYGKRKGNSAGWCKLFPDGRGGIFGDFASGLAESWQSEHARPQTLAEREAFRRNVEEAKTAARAKRKAEHDGAARSASRLWTEATDAPKDHGYLIRKGVLPHGVRVYRGNLSIHGMPCDGAMLVPIRNASGDLRSLQFIAAEKRTEGGDKRYIYSGERVGCYHAIGKPNGIICIVEGYATGASVHEITEHAVAVAFDAGNLKDVAVALRAKYPELQITVCADDDYRTSGNPGITKATEAARAVGGLVAIPDFGADRPDSATDFNDLASHRGPGAVERAIANAKAPDIAIPQPETRNATAAVLSGPPKSTTTSAGVWPDPAPLVAPLPLVQPFNELLLPASLRPWIMDAAERMQCPPDYQAVAAMVSLATVVGRQVGIRPKLQDDWLEVPNLWGLIVGPPGVMKTPALREGMAPLRKLEAKASEKYETERSAWERAAELHKIKQAAKKSELFKAASKGSNIAADELLGNYAEPEPQPRRYQINDTSTEALGEILRYNPNGVLANRDEISGLLKALDKEGNEGMRAFYLSAWTGREPYTFDRIARGLNLRIEACCLSLLGTIQPALIGEHLRQAMATAGGDGLVARFQLLVYPDIATDWRDVDRKPNGFAKNDAYAIYERLDALTPDAIGADPGDIPFLRFEPGARERFSEWHAELERRLRGGDEHPAMVAHLAKYPGLAAKLALLSHLADGKSGSVDVESTERALGWVEYLETHAARAYRSVAQAQMVSAAALLHRIRKRDVELKFRARDVYQKAWAHLATAELATQAMRILVDYDYLRAEDKDTGGRPTTIYTVNPKAMT
jgi:putative DNA primase/helicase